jgi:hypothetical protein
MKGGAAFSIGARPQAAAMRLNDRATDSQSQACSLWFGGEKCTENLISLLFRQAYACVADRN